MGFLYTLAPRNLVSDGYCALKMFLEVFCLYNIFMWLPAQILQIKTFEKLILLVEILAEKISFASISRNNVRMCTLRLTDVRNKFFKKIN